MNFSWEWVANLFQLMSEVGWVITALVFVVSLWLGRESIRKVRDDFLVNRFPRDERKSEKISRES